MIVPMTPPAPKEPRPAREIGQFAAVLWTGLVAVFVAAGALFGFAWLVARKLPWHLTEKTRTWPTSSNSPSPSSPISAVSSPWSWPTAGNAPSNVTTPGAAIRSVC
jgi:hypothetical protein